MTTNTIAYRNFRHDETIELTAQVGRTYTKRVRRGHGETKRTKLIEKQVYADKRGWLYIINEDEHGIRTAEKVSYRDCHYGRGNTMGHTIYEHTNMYGQTVYSFDAGIDHDREAVGTIDLGEKYELRETELGTVCIEHAGYGEVEVKPVLNEDGKWTVEEVA